MYLLKKIVLILLYNNLIEFTHCSINDYDEEYDDELISTTTTTIQIPQSTKYVQASDTNSNGVGSTLSNHYQIITICNSLPSILKCQNKHHFLILERVTYSVSNLSSSSSSNALSCMPQVKCMQVDEQDQFNCTGSNICVFYPQDRPLFKCNNLQSNLTQLHITCVNLVNFKRYYARKYNTLFKQEQQLNKTLAFLDSNLPNETTSTQKNDFMLTIDRIGSIQNRSLLVNLTNALHSKQSNSYFKEINTIAIILSCTFSLLVSIVIFLYVYYRVRVKQSQIEPPAKKSVECECNEPPMSPSFNLMARPLLLMQQLADKLAKMRKLLFNLKKRNIKVISERISLDLESISEPINLTTSNKNINNNSSVQEPCELPQQQANGFESSCNCLDVHDKLCDYCMMQIKKSPSLLFRKVPMDSYDQRTLPTNILDENLTITNNATKESPLNSYPTSPIASPYVLYDIPEVDNENDESRSVSEYYYQEVQKF